MFIECTNLISVNLSAFHLNNISEQNGMFIENPSLEKLDIGNTSDINGIFSSTENFKVTIISSASKVNSSNLNGEFSKITREENQQLNCTLRNINDTYKINIVMTHSDIVSRILFIYSKFEPIISYVQGMNEILAPIYYCFSFDRISEDQTMDDIEADTFWSFYNLMSHLKVLFDKNEDKKDDGINGKVNRLKNMLKVIDKQLYEHLDNSGFDFSVLAFRWISLMFSQDFLMMDLLRLWDYLFCHENKYQNCYFFCLSIILMKKEQLMKRKVNEIYETFQNIKDLELEDIISNARFIEKKCGKKCLEIMNGKILEDKKSKKK
jgi:hypothetical protein